mmetsp:Transcript_16617/g.28175  ORF Transcript_16617/g.28175 Transcript_16617/m.28175 type:complete len:107 (+) Transcript_16617:467-787(+)
MPTRFFDSHDGDVSQYLLEDSLGGFLPKRLWHTTEGEHLSPVPVTPRKQHSAMERYQGHQGSDTQQVPLDKEQQQHPAKRSMYKQHELEGLLQVAFVLSVPLAKQR